VPVTPRRESPARRVWFASRLALPVLAAVVALAEPWDVDGDGAVTARDALLFPVRVLAFPLHLLLRAAPGWALAAVGLPEGARWPASALAAVALSLPLWGLLLVGGLVAQAGLELAAEARRRRRREARDRGDTDPG
jgi:hypothetical protein